MEKFRKFLKIALRSHSKGAEGGIQDQLWGRIAGIVGSLVLLGIAGYVISELLAADLEAEVQTAVSASVTKSQVAGKFPSGLERSIARSLSDGEDVTVKVADYEVSMGHGEEEFINGVSVNSTTPGTYALLRTAVGGADSNRDAILIVEAINDKEDCDTIVGTNLLIGKLKGVAYIATEAVGTPPVTAGTPTLIGVDDRTIGFDACDTIGSGTGSNGTVSIAFGYSFR